MRLSVIVPAHNEEVAIGQTLAHTCEHVRPDELLVANVSSSDRTGEIASRYAQVLKMECTRGAALNQAAAVATGDVLLFLHADTLLPPGTPALMESALADSSVVGGGSIGLLAGFYGNLVDNVLMRLIDILMAFPYVLLAIALVAALGPGLFNALIAIAVVNISFYARGVRAAVLVVRRSAYIGASRAMGASDSHILQREVLPNVAAPLLVFLTLNVGALIVETAGLSFIGLGAQPPTADLGTMLADGRQFMMTAPHVAAIPGVAVLALVWGLNMMGDGLRDMLDPVLAHTTR